MTSGQRIILFISALLMAILAVRTFLSISPFSNLNFGPYNIHHLFIGAFLLVIAVILLVAGFTTRFVILLAGLGSALILDEIVYLIATDGSDRSYLTAVSWQGMAALVSFTLVIAGITYTFARVKRSSFKNKS